MPQKLNGVSLAQNGFDLHVIGGRNDDGSVSTHYVCDLRSIVPRDMLHYLILDRNVISLIIGNWVRTQQCGLFFPKVLISEIILFCGF